MAYLIGGLLVLLVVVGLGRAFVGADPHNMVRAIRYGLGGLLILLGGFLTFERIWWLGLPLIGVGASAVVAGRIGALDLGGGRRSKGTSSTVRSAWLEMRLDHDSGAMTGTVSMGNRAGESLDDIDVAGLQGLYEELKADAESVALLEAYLDRRVPGWREDLEADEDPRPGGTPDASPMTDEEAYEVLGLAPGAGEAEIRTAHRRLMKRLHPDQGGSTFLAAKINEAKDRLLGRRHR